LAGQNGSMGDVGSVAPDEVGGAASSAHVRPVSENERAYVELGQRLALPVIQLVLAFEGVLALEDLALAVAAAAEACPDARARLRGGTWVDSGLSPRVRELQREGFDARALTVARDEEACLGQPMRPDREPVTEVILVREAPVRCSVVFRVFHGVMDGQAALAFVANVFRHMRGEALVPQRGTETDRAFLLRHGGTRRPLVLRPDCLVPTAGGLPRRDEVYWLRRTMPGRWLGLTARVARAVAVFHGIGPVRVLIPANVRRLEPHVPPSGNMTVPLYLAVSPDDDWSVAYRRMFAELKAGADLNVAATELGLSRWLPSWVVQLALGLVVRWQARTRRFFSAATITNLGRVDLATFSTPQARARTLYSLPTHQPLVPFSLALTEHDGHVEVVLSAYAGVMPPARGLAVLDAIAVELA
jgi:hypothetical protein